MGALQTFKQRCFVARLLLCLPLAPACTPRRGSTLPLTHLPWCTTPAMVLMQALHDTVFDEFVVAHTLGWWGKALIIRNYTML